MSATAKEIDAILPQTQCGLCGYNGCMPYATALAEKQATINLCPPGGVAGLQALGQLLQQDPTPYLEEMQQKAKPLLRAVIREKECIGCTKCIQACPIDAILGAAKQMHTIIADECSGCELCIAPCPVDCIDLVPVNHITTQASRAEQYRQRFVARENRLHPKKLTAASVLTPNAPADKKQLIQEAIERAKSKKNNSTLS